MPAVDPNTCLEGRVLRVHRLSCTVEANDGKHYRCAVRQLLRSLATDERNIVTTGDRVWIRPSLNDEGFIERIEPRHGVLTRASRSASTSLWPTSIRWCSCCRWSSRI